ncbi:hypothetical protein QBC37DRAFT_252698, partial [Rhypophila decipiens]
MAVRYSADFLIHLRDSPLCIKPLSLPPAEEWMGPPPETFRNQAKPTNDRIKGPESALLNQENRRPPLDRNGTRNSANPDDMILGPPKTNFASATSMRNSRTGDQERGFKDADRSDRPTDRFGGLRTLASDVENSNDRYRDTRDGRNNTLRRRGDQGDQDSDGWTPVKPRKSFGHEGAERFQPRMGTTDRFNLGREERRPRDRDDRDSGDRRNNRNMDLHGRDKDIDHAETTPRRNGLTRGKTDPWFKDSPGGAATNDAPISQRERIERAKSWRDRDPEEKPIDRHSDRINERGHDRRWDRDQRVERDPEWFGDGADEKPQAHTAEDFKKFMESMKASRGGGPSKSDEKASASVETPTSYQELEQKVVSAPAVESGPDKFFTAFGSGSLDTGVSAEKPKAAKSSRFMAFLAPQEDNRAKTEPATPAALGAPPGTTEGPPKSEAEKEAFALLIQKLHRSGLGPPQEPSGQPQPGLARLFDSPAPSQNQQQQSKSTVASPEPFQQYGGDRRDDPRLRGPPQQQPSVHEILSPRQMGHPTQTPVSRPEQALQDLLAQRHPLPPQPSNRASQNSPAVNSNTEFLMRLMQSHQPHREVAEPPRPEQGFVRMPQPTKQVSLANIPDREQEYQRDRSVPQRQLQQRQGPPGFLEDQFQPQEMDHRPQPQQPTQILQRPPPPGLDHHMLPFPLGVAGGNGNGGGPLPPQHRPMIPPPGLVNGPPPRNGPMPGMFPPNFPPLGAFPGPHPAEGLVGPGPPRSMQPPPGFFPGGPPPPGFLPP